MSDTKWRRGCCYCDRKTSRRLLLSCRGRFLGRFKTSWITWMYVPQTRWDHKLVFCFLILFVESFFAGCGGVDHANQIFWNMHRWDVTFICLDLERPQSCVRHKLFVFHYTVWHDGSASPLLADSSSSILVSYGAEVEKINLLFCFPVLLLFAESITCTSQQNITWVQTKWLSFFPFCLLGNK